MFVSLLHPTAIILGAYSELGEKLDDALPPPEGREGPRRVNASALRLCNNGVSDLTGLHASAALVVKDPTSLKWLDLSFNAIESIPQVPIICVVKVA
jgi:hypothetical protein